MKNLFFALLASSILFSCEKGDGGEKNDRLIIKIPALPGIYADTEELCLSFAEFYEDKIACRATYSASTGCTLKLPAVLDESMLMDMPDVPGLKLYMGTVRCLQEGKPTGQLVDYGNDDGFVAYIYSNRTCEYSGIQLVEGWNRIFSSKSDFGALPMPASGLNWIVSSL